jgi:hypothetical protein
VPSPSSTDCSPSRSTPAFDGSERWLELSVRTNGTGAFTTLDPRQKLTATPYALVAAVTTSTNIARLSVPNTTTIATAVPVIANGFVVGANLVSSGSGYTTPPTVTVMDATGSGAALSALVAGGKVTSLTVNSAGSGYSAGATVTIVAPPSNAYQRYFDVEDPTCCKWVCGDFVAGECQRLRSGGRVDRPAKQLDKHASAFGGHRRRTHCHRARQRIQMLPIAMGGAMTTQGSVSKGDQSLHRGDLRPVVRFPWMQLSLPV